MDRENDPALEVSINDKLEFETLDCFQDQIRVDNYPLEKLDFSAVNPATGPVYIKEAKVGDILAITIEKIEIAEYGILASSNLIGTLQGKLDKSEVKLIEIKNNKAKIDEKIEIDINPMIGVIGVAPTNEGIICGAPDYHGGNMDTKEIREGSTIFFKVNVDGGLLALGDLHAAMGDGEISGTGIEVSGKVTLSLKLIKNEILPTPSIKLGDEDKIVFLYSDESLDTAADKATEQCYNFLTQNLKLDRHLAIRYMSVSGNLGISQIVDPKKTAKFILDLKPLRTINTETFKKFNI
jgi:amidase